MEKIVLYTTHCPKCRVLEKKLSDKNVKFEICQDVQVMKSLQISSVPMLSANGELMDFYNAVKFVNNYKG